MEGIQVSISSVGPNNDVSVIKVGGYIDTTTSAEVERALDSILKQKKYNIIIDLSNVDYISSAGWGIFISEIKGIREKGGDLKLVNMIPDVYEVFELLEFHYILKAFDSTEEALNDFEHNSFKSSGASVLDQEDKTQNEEANPPASQSLQDINKSPAQVAAKPAAGSVNEKIKQIIMEKPDISVLDIKKELNTEAYNFTKVGVLEIWKRLRKTGLSSKKKRMEYFKTHAFQS